MEDRDHANLSHEPGSTTPRVEDTNASKTTCKSVQRSAHRNLHIMQKHIFSVFSLIHNFLSVIPRESTFYFSK